jgi:hypothetical protein
MSYYTGAKPDEVFVGNTRTNDGVPEYLRDLRTARLGEQALDLEGNKIDPAHMRPLFIGRSEADAYHRIMMQRTFPNQHLPANAKGNRTQDAP